MATRDADGLPFYTGEEDLFLWTFAIDLHCWKQEIEPKFHLGVGLTHLEGKALEWVYQWKYTEFTWKSLKKALKQDFVDWRKAVKEGLLMENGGIELEKSEQHRICSNKEEENLPMILENFGEKNNKENNTTEVEDDDSKCKSLKSMSADFKKNQSVMVTAFGDPMVAEMSEGSSVSVGLSLPAHA